MLRKILAALLALVLTAAPAALGESGQIAELEARIAELEAENAQLRELLSQEETGRLVAARFDGGIVTVQDAAAAYDSQAYYYEMLGLDPTNTTPLSRTKPCAASSRTPFWSSRRRNWRV